MSWEPVATIAVGVWFGGVSVFVTLEGLDSARRWWRSREHVRRMARVRR